MKYFNNLTLWLMVLLVGVVSFSQSVSAASGGNGDNAIAAKNSKACRDARMAWWRKARFGMFIHWGVYSVPAGTYHGKRIRGIGEWIMHHAKIPVAEYRKFARQFNPIKYDPVKWAKMAHDAGMRYMIITAKHHDGFALFPSKASKWNVVDATPYGKDLIGPLARAARAEGLKFGLYYSQAQDWNNPGGAKSGYKEGTGWDKAQYGSFDEYLRKVALPQVKEILSRYHPDIIWWDTPWWMTKERAKPFAELLAKYPNIITNNRLGGGFRGDTDTPEQRIPATGIKGRDWETCMTINDTWGYKSYDHNWKSSKTLIRNLIDIVSKGGNYLLNVGPTAQGTFPPAIIERLKAIGKWMKVNHEAIYGTTASPFRRLPWGRCTVKKGSSCGADIDTLYLHVFNWPKDDKLVVPGLHGNIIGAHILGGGSCAVSKTGNNIVINLPATMPDPVATVVALTIKPGWTVDKIALRPDAQGVITMTASYAELHQAGYNYNSHIKVQSKRGKIFLTNWRDARSWVSWAFLCKNGGEYMVTAQIASPRQSKAMLIAGKSRIPVIFEATGGANKFRTVELGRIKITAGQHELNLKPVIHSWKYINLQKITLHPVRQNN